MRLHFLQWIDRQGTVEWPPEFSDLTHVISHYRELKKDRAYAQPSCNVYLLKLLIAQEFVSLNMNIESCRAIYYSVADH